MKGRKWMWLLLGACHLTLVSVGAMQLPISFSGVFGDILRGYGAMTGANTSFSFFAPNVGTQLRTRFEIRGDQSTAAIDEGLMKGASREVELRVNKIITTYWDEVSDAKMRRSISASLAGKVLSRHPAATDIALRLDEYEIPSMGEYEQGARPGWKLFYRARFLRNNSQTR